MARTLSGKSKERERQEMVYLIDTVSRRFESDYKREIYRAMVEYGDNAGNIGKQAEVNARHHKNLLAILTKNYTESGRIFGGRVAADTQKAEINKTPMFVRAMNAFISIFGARRVTEIANTTKKQARNIISNAIKTASDGGLGEIETGKLIRSSMKKQGGVLSSYRSRVIARTETATAANTATHEAGKATGLPLVKEWATAIDGRERDTHKHADGQRVGMNEKFIVGKAQLSHPSDPRGRAEEVINCRCVELLMMP